METPTGLGYTGYTNITETGRTCQRWGRQYPHTHGYGFLYTEENYCRNWNDEEDRPWCYTTDPDTRWELCDIPMCSKYEGCSEIIETPVVNKL